MNLVGGQTLKTMSTPTSSVSFTGDGVSDQFPAGLRVLVVDDDPTCLRILEKMLRNCLYEVTKCNRAEVALSLLRENRNGFDIVISDVHMPDMDGFKLLEHVGLEMDLPVIMMSADDSKNVVMKGVTHGACDYLIKPVRMEALKNIWQHVVRKKRCEWNHREFEQSGSVEDGDRQQKPSEDVDCSSSASEGNWKNSKKRKDEEEEADERDDTSTLKKPRVVWSVELHQQFVAAVNQLGIDKAVPKRILELMNVPGLTRENVASHLQKYRLYLKRLSGVSQHPNVLNNSFLGPPEAAFGSVSSLNGLDLQALAASGQLPAQSLATLQATALRRSTSKSGVSIPIPDQRNVFNFETQKIRFGDGQQQLNNSNKQMNLLHGIPTNMEVKQLGSLHSAQPFPAMSTNSPNGSILMQMSQTQLRAQRPNDTNGSQGSRIQSSLGQSILSNSIPGRILAPKGVVENVRDTVYNPVSQTSPMVDFSMNQNAELPGNNFPVMSNSGMSSFTSKGMFQEEANSEIKGSTSFVPGYDIFNELHQQKPQDWCFQNVRSAFDVSQPSRIQRTTSEGFSSNKKGGQNASLPVAKATFSGGEGRLSISSNVGQQLNPFILDNSFRVKAERQPDSSCQNTLFQEQFGQDDLMSALLKQQQEGILPVDNDFGFDGYSLDNLPV